MAKTISLKQVPNYPGNHEIIRKMVKEFHNEYEFNCKTMGMPRKEHLRYIKEDVDAGYMFFIMLGNKRIGYVLAPEANVRKAGEFSDTRYIDTRFVQSKYQGLGYGTKVLDLAVKELNVTCVRLKMSTLMKTKAWWIKHGFEAFALCGLTDSGFQYELKNKDPNPHCFVYNNNYVDLDKLKACIPWGDMVTETFHSEHLEEVA